jgi:outer membrane lipoprotein-sorting protein
MKTFPMHLLRADAAAALAVVALTGWSVAAFAVSENKPTPALEAFATAWAAVHDYSENIITHETTNDGKETQDRTYSYEFVKPTSALIQITDGPGKGGGAAWHGGDQVKGHQGGLFSGVKLIISKSDPRATSLRGDQIDVASFGFDLDHFLNTPGTLSEAPGPTVQGQATTAVTLAASPAEPNGVTKEVLDISATTHLPVKREQFAGAALVKSEEFKDLKLNPGLTVKDINL